MTDNLPRPLRIPLAAHTVVAGRLVRQVVNVNGRVMLRRHQFPAGMRMISVVNLDGRIDLPSAGMLSVIDRPMRLMTDWTSSGMRTITRRY
jgi:hypothetical protein